MLKIYLARHGQSIDNANKVFGGHRDAELTELGRQQAKKLANYILEEKFIFDHVYCSPLLRAKETAKIITDELGLPEAEVLPQLIERNVGEYAGVEIEKAVASAGEDPTKKIAGTNYLLIPRDGETFDEALARATAVLEDLRKRHSDSSILLVCHAEIGKMLYASYYNLDWQEVLKTFYFGNSDLLVMSPDTGIENIKAFENESYNK